MVRGQNHRFYWIYWIFSPFDLLVGGQNDRFYWIYWIFSTFRLFDLLLMVKMIEFTEYYCNFWLFDFSTSCCEVKLIDFTEYIEFSPFRLFDLLLGVQIDRYYWIYWIFSTFRPHGGRSKWSNLPNILYFFDFSIFRSLAGRSKWLILLNILIFFDFSTSCWDVKLIDFTGYIAFFRLFDFWTLEGGWGCLNWPGGKIHGASVRSNIKNTVSVNLKAVCNIQSPEKTKHARTKEWTLLLLTFF